MPVTGPASVAAPFDEAHVARLRAEFEGRHLAVLRGFLRDDHRERVSRELRSATFVERDFNLEAKTEALMVDNAATALLFFLCNDPRLFALVREVTGCEPISRFGGRTYRMLPDAGHRSAWHDDAVQRRQVALSVNLSEHPYRGGTLQVRDASTRRVLSEAPALEHGDAVLIRIRRGIEHRITDLEGTGSKSAHVGFFYADERAPLAPPALATLDEDGA